MLTYGFYNSKDHDRLYDALQMSSIFDGIVRDGIFMSIGECFRVKQDANMTVLVSPGRAWFNHTWTLNDALLPVQIPQSEVILNRIDAIVIEVNATLAVRANFIKVIKGTPATNPARPTLTNTREIHQYPLAYVTVNQRVTSIRQADITNMVGTSQAPFVTGILDTVNIDMLVAQWGDQWKAFFEKETADMTATNKKWKQQWETWYNTQTEAMQNTFKAWVAEWLTFKDEYEGEMIRIAKSWREKWETWFYAYVNDNSKDIADWKHQIDAEFNSWWDSLKEILDENCCANLAEIIVDLTKKVEELTNFQIDLEEHHVLWSDMLSNDYNRHEEILDSDRRPILDSDGNPIMSRLYSDEPVLDSDGRPIELRSFVQIV